MLVMMQQINLITLVTRTSLTFMPLVHRQNAEFQVIATKILDALA